MQTLSRLFARFKQMNYAPVTGLIAFEPLANSLDKDETILKLLEGSYQASLGLIIATDLRIFYIGINRFNKTKLEQVPYEDIRRIEITEPKIVSVEININTIALGSITIKGCDYNDGKQFVELVKMLTLYNNSVPHAS